MKGRVCLVTGATSGIGKETARALALQGATVAVVGRNRKRAAEVCAEIQGQVAGAQVDYLLADFTELAQVRQLAAEFQSRYDRLDVLVNNAGGMFSQRAETQDGFEVSLGVNHLAHFLLTNLLLDRMTASAPARVINVSSMAHIQGRIDLDDLHYKQRPYRAMGAYSASKLAQVMFTYELARRLTATGVTANVLHPGVVYSNFGNDSRVVSTFYKLAKPFLLTAGEGAETPVYLAAEPSLAKTTGRYFVRRKPVNSSRSSYDQGVQRRLWEVSAQLVGL